MANTPERTAEQINRDGKLKATQRQGAGLDSSAHQAEEYIQDHDQADPVIPGDSTGLTPSSSPGQSLRTKKPPQ